MKNNYFFGKIRRGLRFSLSVFLMTGWFSAQTQKLDPTFRLILQNKTDFAKSDNDIKALGVVPGNLHSISSSVQSSKSNAEVLYNAIIYSKDVPALKSKGIQVQSTYPKFVTALVSASDLQTLQGMSSVQLVRTPKVFEVNNEIARGSSGASLVHAGTLNNTVYKGKGVLVGVIDTGIDWAHPDFRDPLDQSKSRILKIWDQTLASTTAGNPPATFSYGREYTKADIEAELAGTGGGYVQEKDINGHGTHVAGTAAGNGAALPTRKFMGMAPEADLVIVKAGNGSFSDDNIINGINYMQQVATSLNRPIVVNMSLGGQYTAHDGTGAQEDAVNAFTASAPGRVMVIAAGNDNGSNIHTQNIIQPGASATITLVAGSNTDQQVLWRYLLYSNNSSDVSAVVTDPAGNSLTLAADSQLLEVPFGLTGISAIADNSIDPSNNNRSLDFIIYRTTAATDAQGNWTITFTNNGATSVTTDGWLYQSMKSSPTGPSLVIVKNGDSNMLVGSPGDAASAITVASYSGRASWYTNNTNEAYYLTGGAIVDGIAPSSSHGPLRNNALKPDIAATGHFIGSAIPSNLVTSTNSSMLDTKYYQIMTGTSMASPVVTGAAALILQMKPTATASEVKNYLTANTQKDAITGTMPNTTWGAGKLDVYQAGAALLGISSKRKTYTYETIPYPPANSGGTTIGTKRLGMRYTPDITGKIGGFYINSYAPNPAVTQYIVEVRDDNAGFPGNLLGTKTIDQLNMDAFTWNYFDLSDLNVPVSTGKNYHIVIYSPDSGANWSMVAATSDSDGTIPIIDSGKHASLSTNNGSTWTASSLTYRMRSVVYETVGGLGVAEGKTNEFGIEVYPNPVSDVVNVKLDKAQKSTVKVFDATGRLVRETSSNSQNVEMNISALPHGMYILNIKTEKESVNKKIIKK